MHLWPAAPKAAPMSWNITMATTYVTLREKYEVNVNRFKKKTRISLLVKFGLMKLTKLTNMSLVSKQSTNLAGIHYFYPFLCNWHWKAPLGKWSINVCMYVCMYPEGNPIQPRIFEFFIERLCTGLWSGCFSISPHPTSYVFSFHCFISVMGAWNGGSWLTCGDLPATGAVFYLGAGWPQWKPLGIYPRHPPST